MDRTILRGGIPPIVVTAPDAGGITVAALKGRHILSDGVSMATNYA